MDRHYGPAFYTKFYRQNELIRNGTIPGVALNFNSLSIGNGIIDEHIQGRIQLLLWSDFRLLNSTDFR